MLILKIYFNATSTNGHFLSDENCQKTIQSGLKRLIISIDEMIRNHTKYIEKMGNMKKLLLVPKIF